MSSPTQPKLHKQRKKFAQLRQQDLKEFLKKKKRFKRKKII